MSGRAIFLLLSQKKVRKKALPRGRISMPDPDILRVVVVTVAPRDAARVPISYVECPSLCTPPQRDSEGHDTRARLSS